MSKSDIWCNCVLDSALEVPASGLNSTSSGFYMLQFGIQLKRINAFITRNELFSVYKQSRQRVCCGRSSCLNKITFRCKSWGIDVSLRRLFKRRVCFTAQCVNSWSTEQGNRKPPECLLYIFKLHSIHITFHVFISFCAVYSHFTLQQAFYLCYFLCKFCPWI